MSTVVKADDCCGSLRVESPRKRAKAGQKSSARKRGRPRKTDSTPEISFTQEEAARAQEASTGAGVSVSVELLPAQTSGSLTSVGKDTLEPVLAAPPAALTDLTFVQSPILAPTLTSLTSPASVIAPSPTIILDTASVPAQDLSPALAPVPDVVLASPLSQTPAPVVPAPPPIDPLQVETISTESRGKEASDSLVLIEDVGPDEEEDLSRNKEKSADEGNNFDCCCKVWGKNNIT